jgi:hypothetical protein
MKSAVAIGILALCLAPRPCFALWGIATVSKEQAEELGMEVRGTKAGPDQVNVELEFGIERELKDFSRVDLRITEGDQSLVTAPLQEDRSEPGRVVVSFSADRSQLDRLRLWVMVPESLGGTVYEVRGADFVE